MTKPAVCVVAAVLVLTACGGGGDDEGGAATTAPPETTAASGASTTAAPTTAAPTTAPATTAAPTTAAPTTTTTTEPPVPEFDLADIPTLLADIVDNTAPPLELAQRTVGFPVPIGVPDGSKLYRMEVTTFVGADETEWRWLYEAFAPGDVGDIDIRADDQGPGAVALAELYDPIMADLGYRRNGSTGSDPGEPGGPNSINHVYPPEGDVIIAGAVADVPNVKVWATEDLVFPDDTLEPGYRVDLDAGLPRDVEPVPLLAALRESIPIPDGAIRGGSSLRLNERSEDSFDADLGLRYLDISLLWGVDMAFDDVVAFYAAADLSGGSWLAAEPSFFNDGEYEATEIAPQFGEDQALPILLLLRYPGDIVVSPTDDGGAVIELEVRLEPNRPELLPPAE